ncbi:DUF402 domain-containing protein [Streptomyces sp. NPDC057486]|uniref:DUF402 domain-containing protein n=1 Tax=Streptomyces sp. NPDC057486 TaxID=3346145 RepID=UPI003688BF01
MYCDMCTVPEWNADGTVLRMVDLDLDVVRPRGGEARIEDEFTEHRVRYGYPDSVIGKAQLTSLVLVVASAGWVVDPGVHDADGDASAVSCFVLKSTERV